MNFSEFFEKSSTNRFFIRNIGRGKRIFMKNYRLLCASAALPRGNGYRQHAHLRRARLFKRRGKNVDRRPRGHNVVDYKHASAVYRLFVVNSETPFEVSPTFCARQSDLPRKPVFFAYYPVAERQSRKIGDTPCEQPSLIVSPLSFATLRHGNIHDYIRLL